jgi:dTMP kinase
MVMFLSLDGIDGCGKTTQCRALVGWLCQNGQPATLCIDPGGTPLGSQLREILLHSIGDLVLPAEALLFMASRAQLVHEVIRPALARGEIVVSDRFTLANVVYQGHAGGLDVELLWQVGRLATGGLEPDRTFVLDLPVDLAASRRGRPTDRVEKRSPDYHERVRQGFLTEAVRRPERISVLDATVEPATVQESIQRQVRDLLKARTGR